MTGVVIDDIGHRSFPLALVVADFVGVRRGRGRATGNEGGEERRDEKKGRKSLSIYVLL